VWRTRGATPSVEVLFELCSHAGVDEDERRVPHCDLLDASGRPERSYLICIETFGSGPGEAVLIVDEGSRRDRCSAWRPLWLEAAVIGDQLTFDRELVFRE
jgi:microcompartment protein CcmK/EutM